MFNTSTVFPDNVEIISPGLYELPEIMFSHAPIIPITFVLSFLVAISFIVPSTVPAPPISQCIISILLAVCFIEYPPVSYVTPFPTRPIISSFVLSFIYFITIKRGFLVDARPTAKRPFNPNSSHCFSSYTSTSTPS